MSDYPIPGYFGRVLVADLSRGEVRTERLDPDTALDYLGGRGLATRLLYDTIDPACDPLGPDNAFVIASSPLVGTSAPTSGRGHMVFKSPLTDVIGTSNSGGTWGAAFKSAGYDALVVKGAAASPVMIDVSPDRVEIRPADHLWGRTTHETSDALAAASEPGRPARVLGIGPAGENLVRFAVVANDRNRVYGRCGAGAVWGSKKLKAVRVRGREKIAAADKEKFQSGLDQALYLMKQAPVTKRLMRELGTAGLVELINLIAMLPHRNFQDCTHRDEDVDRISGETLAKTLLEKAGSCYLCPIGCQRHTRVAGRDGTEERGEGPEYETMVLMGPLCGIYDAAAITRANYRANELGLDTMSYGGTVACAMELAGLGLIDRGETGGIDLSFGGAEALEALVGMTARREGGPRRSRASACSSRRSPSATCRTSASSRTAWGSAASPDTPSRPTPGPGWSAASPAATSPWPGSRRSRTAWPRSSGNSTSRPARPRRTTPCRPASPTSPSSSRGGSGASAGTTRSG